MMTGLPDIAGCYRGVFIGIESKMPDGKEPTPVQRLRARQIRDAGGMVLSPCKTVAEALEWLDGPVATRARSMPATAI